MLKDDSHIPVKVAGVIDRLVQSASGNHQEAVVLRPGQGKVQVLNEVGARIWNLVDGTHSVADIVALICAEFEVEQSVAEQDTLDFLNDLVRRGLVQVSAGPSSV